MTTPHDIEYIITPYLEAAGGEKPAGNTENEEDTDGEATPAAAIAIAHTPPEISGLTYESQMELDYAKGFDVFYYQDGYAVINVYDSAQYLVVPEGKAAPEGLESQIKVLQQPLDNIYMAATSVMALFRAMDALADIRFAGMEADGWYVQEAAEAINNGTMLFAGKYSEPDYELLVDKGCDLAIESTMILHDPKVQEMIESLGIPVFIERSSYEAHPLGRTEWIKLYGVLVGKEDEAKTFFDKQAEIISQLADFQNTEKTVAFFYVDTNGTVVVRKSDDYIPSMIQIAGGRYIFSDLQNEESSSASVSLSMEEFYASAMNADYLIYNGTIDLPLSSVKDLLAKSELFAEFKAVKDGNVWTIGKDLYQSTDIVGQLIGDVHKMLTDDATGDMTFLKKVD
ncbi:MAG: ABC transporter substrate-binding protein [Lachnospiraceae bacterium]|nr:ABC transporter substrate-binding protein [Lachnospiraceae bacterium]